ncbi:hypothetical protein D6779_05265 [Candidatus Parcubacteria bacterium]|nr:MAG: hypothetical protein D6779_05265 [Candidatus Parcubacteria bacterium]
MFMVAERRMRNLEELKKSSLVWEFLIEAFHVTKEDLENWFSPAYSMALVVAIVIAALLVSLLPEPYIWGAALVILTGMILRRVVIFLIINRLNK